MNSRDFKKLIKEAVREAVREEFKQVLAEHAASQLVGRQLNENLSFTSDDVSANFYPKNPQQLQAERAKMDAMFGGGNKMPVPGVPQKPNNNIFASLLADTAANLSSQEVAQMRMNPEG